MITFLVTVTLSLLILSFISNYIYVKLLGIKHASFITIISSISYVALVITLSLLSRSELAISPAAAWASGILLGAGYYMLICALLGMIIYIILGLLKFQPKKRLFAYILLSIAGLLTVAGILYSQILTTRNYTSQLSENPKHSKTIALISDTHFGPPRNKILAQRLVKKLRETSPDIILYAGDMYDGPSFDYKLIEPELKEMTRIAPVYFAPGNHEGYGPYNEFMEVNTRSGFNNIVDTITTRSGLTIVGMGYRTPGQDDQVNNLFKSFESSHPSLFEQPVIVIHHSPIMLETLEQNGVDISVHGHTHRGQFWPNNIITRIVYGQYHYGSNFYKNMQVITTSGVGTAGPAMRLFNTPEIVIINVKY